MGWHTLTNNPLDLITWLNKNEIIVAIGIIFFNVHCLLKKCDLELSQALERWWINPHIHSKHVLQRASKYESKGHQSINAHSILETTMLCFMCWFYPWMIPVMVWPSLFKICSHKHVGTLRNKLLSSFWNTYIISFGPKLT